MCASAGCHAWCVGTATLPSCGMAIYQWIVALLVWGMLTVGSHATAATPSHSFPPDASSDTNAPPDTTAWHVDLPGLTVTATRIPTALHDLPAPVTRFDSTALARTGGYSVADLLERRAGVHVRRASAYGSATASVRGAGASQTLLLLDGHRIANPQLGQTDLSLLPTSLLETVEVMHGPAAPLYGSDGMGGAVQLRTRTPSEPTVGLTTEAGAYGHRQARLHAGTRGPTWAGTAAVTYQQHEGDFPFDDRRRANADRAHVSAYATLHTADTDRTRFAGLYTETDRGLPGGRGVVQNDERQHDRTLRVWGHHRWRLANGTLTTRAFGQYDAIRYQNPSQNIDDIGHTYSAQAEAEWEGAMSSRWALNQGLRVQSDWAEHPSLRAAATQQHMSAFASTVGSWDHIRLFPALRADAYRVSNGTNRMALTPRLGLNATPWPTYDALRLHAHAGRSFRMPTLNDRYWQPGGQPDLRPERGWSLDVGLRWHHQTTRVEATVFQQHHTDRIVWQVGQNGVWSPRNIERVRTRGVEATARTQWRVASLIHLDTGLNATYTQTRNRSTPDASSYNQPLRYVPTAMVKPHATITMGPVEASATTRYVGRRYTTSDGSQSQPPYLTTDAQLRIRQTYDDITLAIQLEINNLFDAEYTVLNNQPMPPQHAHLALYITL